MTPEHESRLRSLAANIVELELRIAQLRMTNIAAMSVEDQQALRGDLMVAEANLHQATSEAFWLKMGQDPLAKA